MNQTLSRILTGIIGLIVGGFLNALIGLISAYVSLVPKTQIVGYELFMWIILPVAGFILGALIGITVGASQTKLLLSIFLGVIITLILLFIVVLGWGSGGDMDHPEGRKNIFFIFSVFLIDGCFISLIVSLISRRLENFLKKYDSSF